MRIFISINPDEITKNKILEIQNDLKAIIRNSDKKIIDTIKWESEDKFHITMFFIGDINEQLLGKISDNLSYLEEKLEYRELKLKFNCIEAFPKMRYPRVIFLSLQNEDKKLSQLSAMLNSSLEKIGIKTDKKFHPHITLGRVKRNHKINLTDLNFEIKNKYCFNVSEFCLMESKLMSSGSEYSVLRKFIF